VGINERLQTNETNQTKESNESKENDIIQQIENTIIRNISKFLNEKLGLTYKNLGLFYKYMHLLFIFIIGFITIFNNNVIHLCIVIVIISLDAISVILLHECPLTTLEKKYLKTTSCEERRTFFDKLNILYNCDHEYEKQIELLINVWSIIAFKCLIIIFLKTFHFKLNNYNHIYV